MAEALSAALETSVAALSAAEWNHCAGSANPFISHAFLTALEESGSASAETGWLPRPLTLRDGQGRLCGCAPLYLKSHSYGEYVFDHGWARAYEAAGGEYYPKLQLAVPFSPVCGPRLLLAPGSDLTPRRIAPVLEECCATLGLSSVHATFCTEAEAASLGQAGWITRIGTQFHWHNAGYADFEAFLASLASRKRKAIRRERREAVSGLECVTLRGPEITRAEWAAFHRFYAATVDRKWGSAYLTPEFFPLLGERLGSRVVLMLARKGGRPVAGALNLMGSDALFGRNWGADGDYPFLHFELCYYRSIEFAITHGLARVEAGAQGEHKLQRGYLPVTTHSAHHIAHSGLRAAVARFVEQEHAAIEAQMRELSEYSPYAATG